MLPGKVPEEVVLECTPIGGLDSFPRIFHCSRNGMSATGIYPFMAYRSKHTNLFITESQMNTANARITWLYLLIFVRLGAENGWGTRFSPEVDIAMNLEGEKLGDVKEGGGTEEDL